jgi:hypothetical protein
VPIVPQTLTPFTNMTTSVQYVMDQCKLHTKLQNFFGVGQITGEPGCGIANRINQMLLQKRMAWKFNRVELSSANGNFFVTQQGIQDFRHAGACCFVLQNNSGQNLGVGGAGAGYAQAPNGSFPNGGVGIDLAPVTYNGVAYPPINGGAASVSISGGLITIQTLDPHPFQASNIGQAALYLSGVVNPAFNSTFVWNQLTQSSSWILGYTIVAIPDSNHIQVLATSGQFGTITHISAANGVCTLSVANTMSVGDVMNLAGLTLNPGLNTGGTGAVPPATLSAVTPTSVSFLEAGAVTNGNETGTISASPSGAPGIWNLGWLESASVQDINSLSFPQPVRPIDAVHRLSPTYTTSGDDLSVCALIDYNNGVIKFRLSEPMGTYCLQINTVFQPRAPKLTGPGSIFQWPDDLSYVLIEMALWQASRFAYGVGGEETMKLEQSAMAALMSALESEDKEDNTQSLTPLFTLMDR